MRDGFVLYRSFAEALDMLPAEEFKEAVTALCKYALDGEEIVPESVAAKMFFTMAKPQIDANNKRSEAGRRGASVTNAKRETANIGNDAANDGKASANVGNDAANVRQVPAKEKEKDKDKEKEYIESKQIKESKSVRFSAPSLNDILEFSASANLGADMNTASAFIDYYTANGWKVGRNPMKDWKAAFRNWVRRDKSEYKPRGTTSNKFNNFPERKTYDFVELERQVLAASKIGG